MKSIEYSGTGRWFQFGQAPSPTLPWPQHDVSAYTAAINFDTSSARVEMTRKQTIEPGRARPAPAEVKLVQLVSGTSAWNLATPAGAPAGTAPTANAAPAAVEERAMEIWSTPQGFVKAALANNATSTTQGTGSEISFTAGGKYKYTGTINAQNQVERVRTAIDNAVLGDTTVETVFADYRDFGGVMFPARISRTQGGHPVLDLTVSGVKLNPAVDIAVPENVRNFKPAPVQVTVETLAPGVFYMVGGSHHSLAIDQRDHIVVVEGPQSEERSVAVIAKVKETIPKKPIKYLINTHVHFDHSGGLRAYGRRRDDRDARPQPAVLREGMVSAPDPEPRSARQVGEEGHLRDVHRQARAHRRQAVHRGARHHRQRPQRRVCDGVSANRENPDTGGRLFPAGGGCADAGRAQPVRGEPLREHPAPQAGRAASRADSRPSGCAG
jgi:hypothetical protein